MAIRTAAIIAGRDRVRRAGVPVTSFVEAAGGGEPGGRGRGGARSSVRAPRSPPARFHSPLQARFGRTGVVRGIRPPRPDPPGGFAALRVQVRAAARTVALLLEERLDRRDRVDLPSTGPTGDFGHLRIYAPFEPGRRTIRRAHLACPRPTKPGPGAKRAVRLAAARSRRPRPSPAGTRSPRAARSGIARTRSGRSGRGRTG